MGGRGGCLGGGNLGVWGRPTCRGGGPFSILEEGTGAPPSEGPRGLGRGGVPPGVGEGKG